MEVNSNSIPLSFIFLLCYSESGIANGGMYNDTNCTKQKLLSDFHDFPVENVLCTLLLVLSRKISNSTDVGAETDKYIHSQTKHTRHLALRTPLDKGEMLALLVFTIRDSRLPPHLITLFRTATEALIKYQLSGNYNTWKWFDECLHSAIVKLSNVSEPLFPIFAIVSKRWQHGKIPTYLNAWRTSARAAESKTLRYNEEMCGFHRDELDSLNLHCCNVGWLTRGLILIARNNKETFDLGPSFDISLDPQEEIHHQREALNESVTDDVTDQGLEALRRAYETNAEWNKGLFDAELAMVQWQKDAASAEIERISTLLKEAQQEQTQQSDKMEVMRIEMEAMKEILRLNKAAEFDSALIRQLKTEETKQNNTAVHLQEVSTQSHTNRSELIVPERDAIVQNNEAKSASESQKWFEW